LNPRDITAMAADNPPPPKVELSDSGLTMPSDSENYSTNHEMVSSSPSTSSAPLVLYNPPSFWGMLRGAAINLVLPFVNGLMLGFGELFAHETAFRLGWSNTKVRRLGCYLAYGISSGGIAAAHANTYGLQIFPTYRRSQPVSPGVEMRELPLERRANKGVGLREALSLE
jgi:hypothetical protein